jgi:hypothetical protein
MNMYIRILYCIHMYIYVFDIHTLYIYKYMYELGDFTVGLNQQVDHYIIKNDNFMKQREEDTKVCLI